LRITYPAIASVFVTPHTPTGGVELKQGAVHVFLPPGVARIVADTISDYLEGIAITRTEIAVGTA
jgi:hypothetical protein